VIRNQAGQSVGAQLVSASDGSAFTGSVTVYVTIDRGTQAVGSVGSGAAAHEGNGYHTYGPAQAETDGTLVAYTFVGTGAVPQTVQVYTRAATPDVNVAAVTNNAITAAALASDAVTEIQSGLSTLDAAGVRSAVGLASANLDTQLGTIDGNVDDIETLLAAMDTDLTAVKATTDKLDDTLEDDGGTYRFTANALEEAPTGGSAPTASEIADAVCDEALSGHTTAGTVGKALSDIDTNAAAIKAKTDNLPADPADQSAVEDAITAAETALATDIDAVATAVATVDTVADAIKLQTDKLTFNGSNQLATNVKRVNDVTLTGNGTTPTPWGPA